MALDSSKLTAAAHFQKAFTSEARGTPFEPLDRHVTIPASKSVEAAKVLQGFAGSWAAQWALNPSVTEEDRAVLAPSPQVVESRLGRAGMGEIYFRPYDFRTNRMSMFGPSLLGHPISFEIVGPTDKSRANIWQWTLNTAGAADVLTLDTASDVFSPAGGPANPLPAGLNSLLEIYGISQIPEEGLYMVILQTGEVVSLDAGGTGGIGDGNVGLRTTKVPIQALTPTSKYEIFRVTGWNDGTGQVTLDSGKRITTYFNAPGATDVIRSVMFLKPAATRLVTIPGSLTAYAFIPPKEALTGDLLPPLSLWENAGAFTPFDNYGPDTGDGTLYDDHVNLPVPKPIGQSWGKVQGFDPEASVFVDIGKWIVRVFGSTPVAEDVGRILHIYDVESQNGGRIWGQDLKDVGATDILSDPKLERLLGWYEIVDFDDGVGVERYVLRRVADFDPTTGVPFYGEQRALIMNGNPIAAGEEIILRWTLHDPIDTLWKDPHPDIDKISSSRLTNLIDPSWTDRSGKAFGSQFPGLSAGRADRAIFDTSSSNSGAAGSNANPGSLLDLGFRVVLFPAKLAGDGVTLVPDFDHPVDSSATVTLDPGLSEELQYIQVDYSAGILYLSHTPDPGEGCDIAPNGIIASATDNPRNELVLFASCVPYSQEEGQLGTGVRVTAETPDSEQFCLPEGGTQTDVFGERLMFPLAEGVTITSGVLQNIDLAVTLLPTQIPPTGYVEILAGYHFDSPPAFLDGEDNRIATFGYTRLGTWAGGTRLEGCFGGGVTGATFTPTAANPGVAVIRRNIVTPHDGEGHVGTDYRNDTTYGFAARTPVVRFRGATASKERDGSVLVNVRSELADSHQQLFDELFSSWLISGGVVTDSGGLTVDVSEAVLLVEGKRVVVPAQANRAFVAGPSQYAYFDCTTDPCRPLLAFADTLPLPGDHDVLLARVNDNGAAVTSIVDLRLPLVDLDKRLDILVGEVAGHPQPQTHFVNLSDAVAFVGELASPLGASSIGQHFRVRVVGPVTEDAADLPIRMPAPGLIIEGNNPRQDSESAIKWSANTALFDLNGQSDLVFRDLAFQYTGSGVLAGMARVVFSEDSGNDVFGLRVENCRFDGGNDAHGFAGFDSASGSFFNAVFRDNFVIGMTDFGIYWAPSYAGDVFNCVIDSCWIIQGGSAQSGIPNADLAGIRLPNTSASVGGQEVSGNRVQNSLITGPPGGGAGFYHGIISHGIREVIHANHIENTRRAGIYCVSHDGDLTITSNHLDDIHLDAPSYSGTRRAISVEAGRVTVANNTVVLDTVSAGDMGIYSTASNCRYIGNYTNAGLTTGTLAVVVGNTAISNCTFGSAFCSNNSFGAGNITFTSGGACSANSFINCVVTTGASATFSSNIFTNGSLAVDDESTVTGNYFGGTATLTAEESSISGNVFVGGNLSIGNGNAFNANFVGVNLTVAGTGTMVSGCYITGSISTNTSNAMVGNLINIDGQTIDIGPANAFCSNFVANSGAVGDVEVGLGGVMTGNRFTLTDGSYRTITFDSDMVISGNFFDCNVYFTSAVSDPENNTFIGNRVVGSFQTDTVKSPIAFTIVGNYFDTGSFGDPGDDSVSADDDFVLLHASTITGNFFEGDCIIAGGGLVISGNRVGDDLGCPSSNTFDGLITGNVISGGIGINASTGDYVSITNNIVGSRQAVLHPGTTSNASQAGIYVTGVNNGVSLSAITVSNNTVGLDGFPADILIEGHTAGGGTLASPGTSTVVDVTVNGNIVIGDIVLWTNTELGIVQGNRVRHSFSSNPGITGNIKFNGENVTVQGNIVDSNIDARSAANPTINGNRVFGDIYANTASPVIVGNNVDGDILNSPGVTTAPPADTLAAMNRVAGNNIYDVAASSGSLYNPAADAGKININ